MQEFKRHTPKGEASLKKGSFLPPNAANLGWFSAEEVTPENFLSVLDMSNLLPENSNQLKAVEDDFLMYADEFGVLRYLSGNSQMHQVKHSPIVKNSEVCVSNLIIDPTDIVNAPSKGYNFTDKEYLLSDDMYVRFAHSFYVSRYFTLISRNCINVYGNRNISTSKRSR